MDETELQHRLTRLAERTAPPPRESLAEVVVARHRSQGRQVAGITALVAAVAAVVVAVPSLTGGPAQPTAATSADGLPAPVDDWAGGLLTTPTRGSLAADTAFVEGVRQLSWQNPMAGPHDDDPDAPLDTRVVVYAGDVAGARFALVAGENTAQVDDDPALQTDAGVLSDVAIAWYLGPAGAAAGDMTLQSVPRGVDSYGGPAGFFDGATGALVVVGEPGDAMTVSPRPVVAADGSVVREQVPVEAPDGIGTAVFPAGSVSGTSLRYTVVRGTESWTSSPSWTGSDSSAPQVPVTWLRPAPAPGPVDSLAEWEPQQLLERLGLLAEEVQFSMVWAGDVPSPVERTSRVSLLAATLPSGAVYLQCSLGLDLGNGSAGGTWCGSGIRPAGTPLAEQTVVVRSDATDMSRNSDVVSSLIVVAPPTAVAARAVDLDGAVLAGFPLVDGVAVVPFPERAATVETLAADGTVLESTRPLTMADLGD
ncbi:hypothetical protein FHX36_001127 [Modestobacter versicolor]|uniref:Uncharacterized protein n=2 Tax=Modestobacter versicolor TaxID=429133 RepID=A0A323VP31_9ACTN|nr:hypothetical protein [Modestobacter versicolor]MBB3675392.1 hypothetical protein [Modestobacter versicolor]PZA21258.1 hypothetical protein DMO24_11270 [Modestobacter versicolor]